VGRPGGTTQAISTLVTEHAIDPPGDLTWHVRC
jgi:hypothetical protein